MRTYDQARAYAEKQRANPTQNWFRLCQKFSRSCVGANAFGITALQAWHLTPANHRHTDAPRPGSIAYWGGSNAGHAAFVVEDHCIYSTDIKRTGKVDRVHYELIHDAWGLDYLGWIDWCPSGALPVQFVPVPTKPTVQVSHVQPGSSNGDVLLVQKALKATVGLDYSSGPGVFGPKTKAAYADWQKHLGFKGGDADGVPGLVSLTALGKAHGFHAAP